MQVDFTNGNVDGHEINRVSETQAGGRRDCDPWRDVLETAPLAARDDREWTTAGFDRFPTGSKLLGRLASDSRGWRRKRACLELFFGPEAKSALAKRLDPSRQ